ncbi:hypothetical protein [Solibacillus sp. FSL K6-1523]|uniref:hypothetical protein n=1 Tax=Solibacillus sp. FSL K6-1523 TaxID=2921471 RepID=UPI0030F913AB
MGFKEDLKREMRNATNDVSKEVEKQWVLNFEGHTIEIMNKMLEETLKVDGEIIAQNIRKSIWSHIFPYSTLSGTFIGKSGKKHKVHVKIGGFIKLHLTVKVDGQKLLTDSMALQIFPWKNKEFLIPFLEQQFSEHGKLVNKDLPDDEFLYDENQLRFAPGLADQLVNEPVLPTYTKKLIKLFMQQVENPSDATRKATYEKIQDEKVISYFHEFLALFIETEKDEALVQKEAIWLLDHAAHREVVKFALLVLGTTNCENLKERLKVIALHEEFTGVALFVLTNGCRNVNDDIWEVAKQTSGWGKLEAMNFLEPGREEIRLWFLTHGVEGVVEGNHAPLLCAEKGQLDIELHEDTITNTVFDGVSKLILALLYEAQYRQMDEYEYAGQVLMRYTKHAKSHSQTLHHFYILIEIAYYMNRSEEEWNERFEENWKPHEKLAVETVIKEMSRNSKWLEEAQALLVNQPDNSGALAIVDYYKNIQ